MTWNLLYLKINKCLGNASFSRMQPPCVHDDVLYQMLIYVFYLVFLLHFCEIEMNTSYISNWHVSAFLEMILTSSTFFNFILVSKIIWDYLNHSLIHFSQFKWFITLLLVNIHLCKKNLSYWVETHGWYYILTWSLTQESLLCLRRA